MVNDKLLKTRNRMIQISMINRLSLMAILVIFLTGCDGIQTTNSISDASMNGEIHAMDMMADKRFQGADTDLIKLVRRATARYHSTNQAIRAGYLGDEHCAAHPELGGMGYHWVNMDLIDPVFDPENPEALLYEPDKNGNLKLVGVEYIVINIGQERPHFGDHPFDIEGVPPLMEAGVPHWSLHVWIYKENPNGMFVPFNPQVSC
jgi:hypothetical protein